MPGPVAALASRRLLPKLLIALVCLAVVLAMVAMAMTVIIFGGAANQAKAGSACLNPAAGGSVDALGLDRASAGDLGGEQLANAKTIVATARREGVPVYGQVVAVATAIQESSLTNIDSGDAAGPDSRGLFQQRAPWGPEEDRLDPAAATKMFLTGGQGGQQGLLDIPGWRRLSVGKAAQSVQRSADPLGTWYEEHEQTARKIVAQVGGSAAVAAGCGNGAAMQCEKTPWPSLEQGLTPDALRVLRCVHQHFPEVETFGGVGDRPANADSDHPSGRAVDAMIADYDTAEGRESGRSIAAWVRNHAPQLGVKYVIFDEKIWQKSGPDRWTDYEHGSGATDDTSAHRDHVHVSVYGDSAGQMGGGAVQLPIGSGGYTLTATYGEPGASWSSGYHTGLDFAAPIGKPIHAVAGGTVSEVIASSAYGNLTKIRARDGTEAWYAHQSRTAVAEGESVRVGQVIGYVGATGNVTGPHLHLEIHRDGSDTDPMTYLKERGVRP